MDFYFLDLHQYDFQPSKYIIREKKIILLYRQFSILQIYY